MAKLDWVKWSPRDFIIGTSRLTPDMGWMYTVVLNWIYEHGGPIPDDIEELAAGTNMKASRAEAALEALVKRGKLVREDGVIFNRRALLEISERGAAVEKASTSAKQRWETIRKKNEQNQPQKVIEHVEATEPSNAIRLDKIGGEKKRKKDSRPAKKQDAPYSEEFEALWLQYPRRANTSKKKAWDLYQMLNAENQERVRRAVPIFAAAMKAEGRPEDKIKHFQFFLSERVYETVAVSEATVAAKAKSYRDATREDWQKCLNIWARDSNWRASWGPEPGRVGCAVPEDLIAAHNVKHRGFMFSEEEIERFKKLAVSQIRVPESVAAALE